MKSPRRDHTEIRARMCVRVYVYHTVKRNRGRSETCTTGHEREGNLSTMGEIDETEKDLVQYISLPP